LWSTPATQSALFCFDGWRFELLLCEEHGELFDEDLLPWVRAGRVVDGGGHDPQPPRVSASGAPVVSTPELRALMRAARREHRQRLRGAPSRAVADGELVSREALPAPVDNWRLTVHAFQRALQRKIDYPLIMAAVAAPQWTRASSTVPGGHWWVRDGVKVGVLPEKLTVATVCRMDEDDDESALGPAAEERRSA
jgi:hypothetical protein